MADIKVSAFTAAGALAPGDLIPVVQSLANRAATASQFTDFLLSSTNLARTGTGVLTLNTSGASNVTFPTTGTLIGSNDVATVSSTMMTTTGVTAGSYTNSSLTVNAQGRITAISNGSSGTPGGSNTQVQFNSAGAFGGDADFTYNSTTNVLTVGGEVSTNGIQALTSGGGQLQTNGGADCLLFGAGGSANGTLYGGWNYDAGTGDRILSLNAGKTITALDTATYPSLTELANVKGVTSAIQTQINGKQATGNYITALTGDVTATGPGSVAATLATVNSNVGSFGLAGSVAQFTVNAKGLITAAANVAISIASAVISDATTAGRNMLTAASVAAQTALLDVFTPGAKGLAPASGGGTTNFLRADGTWAAPAGGGGSVNEYYAFSFDGGGALPSLTAHAHARIPRSGTIVGWSLVAYDLNGDAISGSAVVDLWKDTTANYPPTVADTITASAKPTLTAANIATSTTLTGWTTSIAAGDWIFADLDSVSGTNVSKIVLRLEVQH